MRLSTFLSCLLPWTTSVLANVEKTIFIAPDTIQIPQIHPNLDDLHLEILTPENSTLRTHLPASFPKSPDTQGTISWFLLDNLRQQQRHEVRICWPATQPTAFTLDTYTLPEVFSTPKLITSLASYSEGRNIDSASQESAAAREPRSASVLFLRVTAAADYFTTNKTLMREVPPVHADIILDAFLFNILPRSLLPTGIYLVIVAAVAWYLSNFIWKVLDKLARPGKGEKTA